MPGLAAGCFAAYVPQGPRSPEGHAAARQRALDMLDAIAEMDGAEARVCTTADAVEAVHAAGGRVVVVSAKKTAFAAEMVAFLGLRVDAVHEDGGWSRSIATDVHDEIAGLAEWLGLALDLR